MDQAQDGGGNTLRFVGMVAGTGSGQDSKSLSVVYALLTRFIMHRLQG